MQSYRPLVNIAIVGGDECCRQVLEKTTLNFRAKGVNASFCAVADPDPASPGRLLAERLGLVTVNDYHELYSSRYDIQLIIITNPDPDVFLDILRTRPSQIRIMSYDIFIIFWKAMQAEERKLKARNDEMMTILNGIQDFILVISPDMDIIEANASFLEKMGFSHEQIIGKKCYEIYHNREVPCNEPNIACPLIEVIRNKRKVRLLQSRCRADGETSFYEVDAFPVWEKDGKISKFIHISRDITDRKKEELEITRRLERMVSERTRQLKETHEKLLHQDKMASLGKLSASVVHEINNPIAGILNLIMLVQRICEEGPVSEQDSKKFMEYLSLMETETRRIGKIVSNLLAFSRHTQVERNPVDLNRLINITLFMNSNLLKLNGVKVNKSLDENLPEITGSEDQLEQVFMNLISNAAESMENENGSILSIETFFVPHLKKVILLFEDTGLGIARDDISKIFEPFFTTKKKGKGIGLGLSVAYGIVKDHGGCIEVESEKDAGTTFRIELPVDGKACDS